MRNLTIAISICLLAACSQETATDSSEPGSPNEVATTANGSPPGTYYIAAADGTASLITIYADWTYSQVTPDGGYPSRGTFEIVDGKTCYKVHQIGAEPNCYSETEPGEDGSYVATLEGGEPLTVTPYTAEDVVVSE